MYNKKTIIATAVISLTLFLCLTDVTASTQIDWPTSPVTRVSINEDSHINDLIAFFYGWAIGMAVIIAFLMIIFGGIEYMISGVSGNPSMATRALIRVRSAVLGLTLALSSWLILNTINPQITSLQPLPNLWDVDGNLQNMKDGGLSNQPPCDYVLFYSGEDFQGSTLRQTPGVYQGDAVGYKSVRGYRKITDEEKKRASSMSKHGFEEPRHVEGDYIETNSCSITLYSPTSPLPWSDKCGRPSSTVIVPSRSIEKSVYEDIGCYEIRSNKF